MADYAWAAQGSHMLNRVRGLTKLRWPPIDGELIEARDKGYLDGLVLNAGAGERDISHLVQGTLVNQDIRWGPDDARDNIDIFSSIDDIPRPDNTFDAIVCIAVLEHVENPEETAREFFRVLKPGGRVIASVPFMQPEHKIPTDFQRYTKDGLRRLFTKYGFQVEEVKPLFNVYYTLHWMLAEWLMLKDSLTYRALRVILLAPMTYLAGRSTLQSDRLASVFQIVARKPL